MFGEEIKIKVFLFIGFWRFSLKASGNMFDNNVNGENAR